jgi:prolyl oligopeptidase
METVIRKTGFQGDFAAFQTFLRTDSRFYFTEAQQLITAYRDLCKRIDPELSRLFGKLPRGQYGVRPLPDYRGPSETSARYFPGALGGSHPGYFVVNTYKLESRPKYEMEALALHEAVPGHHLQGALALELEGVPDFRRRLDVVAYGEGWGLYAESLGEELGFYRDPYQKFGQLSFEMWRACRLVVDTGMHAMGWPRERAIEFMKANTALSEQNTVAEVDRCIAWPGQALGYKIGELKFKELRRLAEKELGARFDVREFHDAVLADGRLPLDILESQIRAWIEKKRK